MSAAPGGNATGPARGRAGRLTRVWAHAAPTDDGDTQLGWLTCLT